MPKPLSPSHRSTPPAQRGPSALLVVSFLLGVGTLAFVLLRRQTDLMRQGLLYLSAAPWARQIVGSWSVAKLVARRFVAGETMDDAVSATRKLNARGLSASLDYLGESVRDAAGTEEVVRTYKQLLERIASEGLQAGVSLKLTHLGLDISEALCISNLRTILEVAQQHDIPVTIDMESSDYTDRTLHIHRLMRQEYGFENVGTVIQAYLYRSEADIETLGQEGAHVRLCKGAYLEPPAVAFPEKSDVDANYVHLMELYLAAPSPAYLCIATHDERMISAAEVLIRDQPSAAGHYEFQMLYGIRSARQEELAAKGYPVRIYIPFGEAWYPYLMRRLAERPANVWFFARGFLSSFGVEL
jgi:proline dehydrogenase